MSLMVPADPLNLDFPNAPESKFEPLDVHVVILNNYVRKHHVVAFQELAKRVRELTVLLSVPMEPDRTWKTEWADLDVRVQKSWMFTTNWKHSAGFREPNFIHVPIDTNSQLKSLKPDIVFSYEMGMRTLFSSWYRRFHSNVPLIMVGNMSDHIENERGLLRRWLRWLIRRGVDYYTYNGPGCKRYLKRLAIPDDKLFHVPYCIDPDVIFTGQRDIRVTGREATRKLLYCGALSERKGIWQFVKRLEAWCRANSQRTVELSIAGTGKLQSKIAETSCPNLEIKFLGNCSTTELNAAYGNTDVCVFPSLADEWGLVPIEALASGVPVLGSTFAQSVEAVVKEGFNGWVFEPTDSKSLEAAIARAMNCSDAQLSEMGHSARKSVAHINAKTSAEKFCHVIKTVLPKT